MTETQQLEAASGGFPIADLPFTDSFAGRVLLVVADPMVHLNLSSRLRLIGFEVNVTSGGELARQKFHSFNPHAVVLDLMVDDDAGDELIKELRRNPDAGELPIYAFSSSTVTKSVRRAGKCGVSKLFTDSATPIDDIIAELKTEFSRRNAEVDSYGSQGGESISAPDDESSMLESREAVLRVKRHLELLQNAKGNQDRATFYGELRGKVQTVIPHARNSARPGLHRLTTALHALLKILHEMPECATESTQRTVFNAVDVLVRLCAPDEPNDEDLLLDLSAVVADNDMVSRSVVGSALRSVGFRFECFAHASVVMRYFDNNEADLVIVHLAPNASTDPDFGKKLRAKSKNAHTPVILVSGVSDFENHSSLVANGVDEIITKPFIFMELSVKALSLALKKRLAARQAVQTSQTEGSIADHTGGAGQSFDVDPGADVQFDDDNVRLGQFDESESAGVVPPKLPRSRFKGSAISASVGKEGSTELFSLRDELEKKKQEREKLVSRIFNNELELEQISASLEEEREHRQQLEQMVQDLMVGQASQAGDLAGLDAGVNPDSNIPPTNATPPELLGSLQMQLAEMSEETESLRAALESRQEEREQLATRIYNDELELDAIRAQLEQERAHRAELETRVSGGTVDGNGQTGAGATGDPIAPADEIAALRQAREELLSQLATAQEENQAEFKNRAELEVSLRELTADLQQAREAQQQLESERQRLEIEFEQKLAEANQLAEGEKSAAQEQNHVRDQLRGELEEVGKRQADLETALATARGEAAENDRLKIILEEQLSEAARKLAIAESEQQKTAAARKDDVARLEAQLAELKAAADAGEIARNDEAERANQLQKELEALWKAQEELDSQFTREKESLSEAAKKRCELEERLREVTEQLERSKAEIARAEESAVSETARRSELENRIAGLQSELDERLNSQNQLAVEAGEQKADLERRLKKLEEELPLARQRISELMQEKENLQKELAGQLKEATQAAQTAEDKAKAEATRCQQLEGELAQIRTASCELNARTQAEQKRADEALAARTALEQRLSESSAEIEKLLAARETLIAEHKKNEARLSERLRAADASARKSREQLEQKLKQRNSELEEVRAESRSLAESSQQREVSLLDDLKSATADLANTRHEVEAVANQSKGLTSQLEQLRENHATLAAKLGAEQTALAEAKSRGDRLDTRLSQIQVICDELKAQLEAERERAAQVARAKAELEQRLTSETKAWADARSDFEKQLAAQKRREADLDKELETLRGTAGQAESARQKELLRANKFEAEVTQLWQVRDDLKARVAANQKIISDLGQQKAALDRQLEETTRLLEQSRLDIDSLHSAKAKHEEENRALAEHNAALKSEAAVFVEKQRVHENELASMDRRVRDTIASLARTTAELETERGDRRRTEQRAAGLSAQLQDLHRELNSHLEIEKENQTRLAELERELVDRLKELAAERTAHESERGERREAEQRAVTLASQIEALRLELAERQKLEKETQSRIANLEQQLRAREESLVRVTQHLETEREERRRAEQRAETLIAQTQQLQDQLGQSAQREKEQQNQIVQLEEQGADRTNEIERLQSGLASERSERGKFEERARSLSTQLRDLHNELNEHLRLEKEARSRITELESQLGERQQAMAQLQSDLEKESADRALAEEQLLAAGDISAKLKQYQGSFADARTAFEKTQRELESRLEAAATTLQEREAGLELEQVEKGKLQKALESARRESQVQAQQNTIELSKLESALQVESMERRRLEGDAMHSRYASLQSSRSGRALVNGFRRQLEKPVDQLMQQARRMLSFEMNASLKEVAEALLASAVTLQNNVRECDVVDLAAASVQETRSVTEADTELDAFSR